MQPINEMKVSDPNEAGVLHVLELYKYTSPIVKYWYHLYFVKLTSFFVTKRTCHLERIFTRVKPLLSSSSK